MGVSCGWSRTEPPGSFSETSNDPLEKDTLIIENTAKWENKTFSKRNISGSWLNEAEAEWIIDKAAEFLSIGNDGEKGYKSEDITIITPYRGQIELIEKKILQSKKIKLKEKSVLIKNMLTSRSAQGRENKVVLLSLVRSHPDNGQAFGRKVNGSMFDEDALIADRALLLVSITRAKEKMAIIGDCQTLDRLSSYMYSQIFNFDLFEYQKQIINNLPQTKKTHRTELDLSKNIEYSI